MDDATKLHTLAQAHGFQLSYTDISGATQSAADVRLRQALVAVGGLQPGTSLDEALVITQRERWAPLIEPVVTAWDGVGQLALRVKADDTAAFSILVTASDGQRFTCEGRLQDIAAHDGATIEGTTMCIREAVLPPNIPLGYHDLEVTVGRRHGRARLMCAPRQVYSPPTQQRRWGLFVPLYALHSERSLGVGDFTDLRNVVDWTAEHGGSMVGTLPLLATFLDDPCEPSPYSPVSRLAWNELYLDIAAAPGFATCKQAQRAVSDQDSKTIAKRLLATKLVDHRAAMALKRRALDPLAQQCWQNKAMRAQLEAFLRERPELVDYAEFRALGATLGTPWPTWSADYDPGGAKAGTFDRTQFRYHAYVQWAAHLQLSGLAQAARAAGDGLYLDLPVGVHPDGFDRWRYRDEFVSGLSTGAPPDLLFSGGQNWAFPPPHPTKQRQQHYAYSIASVRNHLRYAGVLRIDHVMGLHRLFVVPDGASAKEGLYLRYQAHELYALLALESHRSKTLLIGENLGTVPDEVTTAMQHHGVRGMHVVQYQARPDPQAALPQAKPGDLASLNTHDMPPFAAFWNGGDIALQHELGFIADDQVARVQAERTELKHSLRDFLARRGPIALEPCASELLRPLVRHLAREDSDLVLLALEDLWGEVFPQNVPGTYREHANWQHRTRYPFEQWSQLDEVLQPLRELDALRKQATEPTTVRHDISKITDDDLHYFSEGTHARIDEILGAHPMQAKGVEGTFFAVWAPAAEHVGVIGDFNDWDPMRCPLQQRGGSGIWEGFVVGVDAGELYKFHIRAPGYEGQRADPMASAYEIPPRTASVIARVDHAWNDEAWTKRRSDQDSRGAPMSIYEVHLGSWRRVPESGDRFLSYREVAPLLVEYVKKMGFTHVELLPVMEHPFFGSWGYQSTGYFAPSSRFGAPQDLMALIDTLHQADIGVLLDWVPSHFPSDEHALARFDGTHLYEHADPRQGHHPDWDSSIFNFGRYEVHNFLVSSARFWLERFHADGLRVDAVASMLYLDYSRGEGEWIPNKHGGRENLEAIALLRKINEVAYTTCDGVDTIAEESTAWPMVSRPTYVGGLGFGFKWDMGWMHDTLRYFAHDPIHRQYHHHELTFRMMYAFGENYVLPLSHDEVVHGKGSMLTKMPGDRWQKFANLRALYGSMYSQPGKKLMFMGLEFAQEREWNHDRSLDWHLLDDPMHAGMQRWVADLNHLYRSVPALHELDCSPEGFEWVDFNDAVNSVFVYLRHAHSGPPVLVVCNFTPVLREGYRVGVPHAGRWHELANSDAATYGGSGAGNGGHADTTHEPCHGRDHSLSLTLPPLGVLLLCQEPRG